MNKGGKLPTIVGMSTEIASLQGLTSGDAFLQTFSGLFLMSATDVNGQITEVNDRFCEVSGYARAELIGSNHHIINSGTHPPEFFRAMWRDIAAGRIWRGEICNRAKDGHLYWVDSIIAPEKDETGAIVRYVSIRTDITLRKQAERTLQTSTQFLNDAPLGWWEADLETRRVFWSDEVCRIYGMPVGYKPDIDQTFAFIIPGKREQLRAAFECCQRTATPFDMEVELIGITRKEARQPVWVRMVGNAERREGRVVRINGAIQDVSHRKALEELSRRITLAAESGQIGLWEYDIQAGTLEWDNVMYQLYGVPRDGRTLTFRVWRDSLHPDDSGRALAALAAAAAGDAVFDTEFRIVRPDGEVRHIRGTGQVMLGDSNMPTRMYGVNWDVTSLRRLADEISEQRELLQVTLASIGDGVITTDSQARITWMNPVAERLTGWTLAEAMYRPVAEIMPLVQQETLLPLPCPVEICLGLSEVVGMADKSVLMARGGEEISVEDSAAPIRSAQGEVLGAVLVFRDVTEQRRYATEMSYRATHDALTDLVNRSGFEARLKRVLATAAADASTHGVLALDLDQFKLVNDSCGHAVGDQALQQVARLLQRCVRSRDTVARLGGDEFAILLERCDAEHIRLIGEKICAALEEFRFTHEGRKFRIGASIGVVSVDNTWRNSAEVMHAADTSSYMAKAAGGNRVHLWTGTDNSTIARHTESDWAARIELALDEDGFTLFGQRLEALDGVAQKTCVEVLLRLRGAEGVLIQPGQFLPAAERFHLASRIDRWVVRNALALLVGLGAVNDIGMVSVNLSGQSIGDKMFHHFMEQVVAVLTPAQRSQLCLEITETSAITNMHDAAEFVNSMRALGVRVALDDFGAGASSFGYLKQLNVDFIKIDGQFITDMLDSPLDDAAVRSFANVAQIMGLKTVAEFVDRPAVLARVREMGIDYGQGYMLHEPQPLAEIFVPN